MTNLTLKFDDDNPYDGMRKHTMGCFKGKWVLRISGRDFAAPTREEVGEKLLEYVRNSLSRTRQRVACVGNELTIIKETPEGTESYRCTLDREGVLKDRGGYTSCDTLEDATQAALYHMAQQDWSLSCSDEPPNYLTDEQAKTWLSWTKWQRSYAQHIANGKDSNEAHRLACSY